MEFEEFENDCAAAPATGRFTVVRGLVRNWTVLRAVALATATAALLALHHPTWVPFAVSAYAIINAAAITVGAARTA
ncbi:hypothetical protein D7D52_08750 [Nocardia yunnanensis]|uniref:Uncharacterized protein n=1 Tax=Nocardia yunnanensis TaxID=2382165 RepID=A0A386Z8I9_9NOCA|nr:hypothetical protein D7D52_08750 [Nocardia yunnanensis]